MATATVNSKGQIIIPVQVRVALGLQPGDKIEFIDLRNGQFAIVPAPYSVERLKGLIRKPKVVVSIDDMNAVFALKECKRTANTPSELPN